MAMETPIYHTVWCQIFDFPSGCDDLNPALNSAQGADFGEPIQLGRRWQRSAFRVGAPGISTGSPAGTSGGSYPPVVKHGNG